jgi:hypothetical protein
MAWLLSGASGLGPMAEQRESKKGDARRPFFLGLLSGASLATKQ